MSTADHLDTDSQTERVNRVFEDILHIVWDDTPRRWMRLIVKIVMNNTVHAPIGYTPFYVKCIKHLRVPLTLPLRGSGIGGGEVADRLTGVSPDTV